MNSLIGIWAFVSIIYQGNPLPPPNPNLKIYYNFENENINEVFYYRQNERGTCRRKAEYKIQNNHIEQTVISVDPTNAEFCNQDTDMQMGNVSRTRYEIINGKLHLYLPIGEDFIVYIWDKIND